MDAYAKGSLVDVLRVNSWEGHLGKWGFMINSGRLWNIVGLSILGFVLGRVGFFTELERHQALHRNSLLALLTLVVVLLPLKALLATTVEAGITGRLFDSYANISLMLLTVLGLAILYRSHLGAHARGCSRHAGA